MTGRVYGMTPENGTRRDLLPELPQMPSEFDELPDLGKEKRGLARSCEIAQEIAN